MYKKPTTDMQSTMQEDVIQIKFYQCSQGGNFLIVEVLELVSNG